jgi:hypothetical protein
VVEEEEEWRVRNERIRERRGERGEGGRCRSIPGVGFHTRKRKGKRKVRLLIYTCLRGPNELVHRSTDKQRRPTSS